MIDLTRTHYNTHVSPKLRRNIRIYFVIAVVMLLVILYRIISSGSGYLYPLLALGIGLIVGIIVSRMYVISWDTDAEHVVSRMDTYGVLFLVVYIIFEISSHYLIEQWLHGPQVLTVILASIGGALLGRGFGMVKKMIKVLRANLSESDLSS